MAATVAIEQMQMKTETIEHTQTVLNSRLHAIVKAKSKAWKLGTSTPPDFSELDEDLLMVEVGQHRSMQAKTARTRIWDTGAAKA